MRRMEERNSVSGVSPVRNAAMFSQPTRPTKSDTRTHSLVQKTLSLDHQEESLMPLPPRSALRKGHSRSASHGGVIGPSTDPNLSHLPSALKKGHNRAASHGQIQENISANSLRARAQSKTEFILPPSSAEDRTGTGTSFQKGHSRQASRSESIYTLRVEKRGSRSWWWFWKKKPLQPDSKTRRVLPNHIQRSEREPPPNNYPNNQIRTTKYTPFSFLPKNLFEQFHRFANLYFISIVLLNWIPAISAFGKEIAMLPVMFVMGVTAIKDLFEDRRRQKSDDRINNYPARVYNRDLRRYVKVKWKEMEVGDIVHLSCNEMIPADVLILRTSDPNGLCYIETMNLDGESNLKQRQVIRDYVDKATFSPSDFVSEIQVGGPTTKIYHFNGHITHQDGTRIPVTKENLLLRDCLLKNTDFIEGIVIYAGRETKAMLNNGGPRHKRTGLEKLMNLEVMWCVVILGVMCIVGATGSSLWLVSFTDPSVPFAIHLKDPLNPSENLSAVYEAFLSFLTYIIILQVMIPLSLYVTIELTKLLQIYHIQNDSLLYDLETNKTIECRAMNIPEDLGQVQYIFSDKTGTLTENRMLFRRCTIQGKDYSHPPAPNEQMENASIPPLQLNPALSLLLTQLKDKQRDDKSLSLKKVADFFMILTLCNTVVVAKHPHHDKMNGSGLIVEESLDEPAGRSLSTILELRSGKKEENSPQTLSHQAAPAKEEMNLLMEEETPRHLLSLPKLRRPGKLEVPSVRPLSPISSSDETTPTDSPAQERNKSLRGTTRNQLLNRKSRLHLLPSHNNETTALARTRSPSPPSVCPIYEAESPDELALVHAAFAYQFKLLKRTRNTIHVGIPGDEILEYELLHTFPFDSVRKRMSVVVKDPVGNGIILYTKGADSAILPVVRTSSLDVEVEMVESVEQRLNSYARDGLRILLMAKRTLSYSQYQSWLVKFKEAENDIERRDQLLLASYNELERNLELIGGTGIEDRLQERVPETIESLRQAGILVWVLTGDKQETAVNIAYSCRLFTQQMDLITINARSKSQAEDTINFYLQQIHQVRNERVASDQSEYRTTSHLTPNRERALVVDGKSLTYILDQRNSTLLLPFLKLTRDCSAVLCCRATPLQKAFIVTSVKDHLKMRTLAIGDGANDVSMIQRADIGVGISGKEGMQAVMASDFAIPKFKYLERLLLVHGHWCYNRLARMILYFFYKNAAFVFVIFWYQLCNGWSGSVMIDQMYLMVFNLIFTALPPMAMGIYDQDARDNLLLQKPILYKEGRLGLTHTHNSFWWNMIDALYASIVIFFVAFGAYEGSDIGMIEFGTTITVSAMFTMLGNMAVESKSWTILHLISVLGSIVFFYAFALLYNSVCMNFLGIQTPCRVIQILMQRPTHWLIIALTVVLAVLPRFLIRIVENSFDPSDVVLAIIQEKKETAVPIGEMLVSWSRSSSRSSVIKSVSPNTEISMD